MPRKGCCCIKPVVLHKVSGHGQRPHVGEERSLPGGKIALVTLALPQTKRREDLVLRLTLHPTTCRTWYTSRVSEKKKNYDTSVLSINLLSIPQGQGQGTHLHQRDIRNDNLT
jgi:hypothetical protein